MIIKALLIMSGICSIAFGCWALFINLLAERWVNAGLDFVGMCVLGVLLIHQATRNWGAIIKLTEE
jgi:hypothetical protein